jgi:molecular chaperone GrpE
VKQLFKRFFSKDMIPDSNDKNNDTNHSDSSDKSAETPVSRAFAEASATGDASAMVDAAFAESGAAADEFDAGETAKLTAALAENAKLRDAYARSVADLENYRRRVAREKEDLRKFATQNLLEDLIPILDNLTIGLDAAAKHPEAAPVTEGFKMVATQIKNALEQHGLKEINPLGETFDPNAHESVSQTPHDTIPDHHVAVVLRVGYRLQDRLVRPATVVLSTGPAAHAADPGPTDSTAAEG